jgi:A/G-specific adenine glycosylase
MNNRNKFWRTLLFWFEDNSRSYPWRETNNVYHILVAEILLQQTHVRKVEPVYHAILNRYPTINDLWNADTAELIKIIEPIGLIYRAQRLKDIAVTVLSSYEGKVPNSYKKLTSLPGVGDYIANAVLCYGYGDKTVPIDTNVIRLFSRYFGLTSIASRPRTDKKLAGTIASLFPLKLNFRDANLAILDFAGLACTAHKPACAHCPLANCCTYQKTLTSKEATEKVP